MSPPEDTPARVVIERITPNVDQGRFAVKRIAGETVTVEADVFTDGHDTVCAWLLHRSPSDPLWRSTPMTTLGNDRFAAEFAVTELGRYEYTVTAWVDPIASWRRGLLAKYAAGQDVSVDLLHGAQLVRATAARALAAGRGEDAAGKLEQWASNLADEGASPGERAERAQSDELLALAQRYPDPEQVLRHEPPLTASVDRHRARFSTWYELFPRSTAPAPGAHGTLADCTERLADIAAMGFDVVYLPPIHPIGATNRKGRNGAPRAAPTDPGSPWAIGAESGGHKAIHPSLGTLEDFRRLVARAAELGLEIALDLAFQCSPDHPYVREHPEWFLHRPDGSVQYAENPPKKYEDIYPFDFGTPAWRELWSELASVVEFWMAAGVRIFRVDNPHTKPLAFWEWLIARVKRRSPEVIFLAEAFTRPKVMYRLAKLGFTQSYTYFAWRNTSYELSQYFTELGSPPVCDFFRPNLWPNTPDILTEHLQHGGRAAFAARLVLAATLGASYGIYGPAFERMEHEPRAAGSEEYRDSEKYQIRSWGPDHDGTLAELITRVNRIRRESPALQADRGLAFHRLDNETLLAYSKTTPDHASTILTVVNLDPYNPQSGWIDLDLDALALASDQSFEVHDLLTNARFPWRGRRNFVRLDPDRPAHIFTVRR
jgi:starch synthase (maltosyl-transferring)